VKTLSLCALLCLLSILAQGGISDALSDAQALPPILTAGFIPPSLPAATSTDSDAEGDFSEYIHLHKTRGEGNSFPGASSMKACAE
jgi:hypothetical protein